MSRFLFCIFLATLSFRAVATDVSVRELRTSCFSSNNVETNCGNYIAAGGTDYAAFIKLANQHKKNGDLAKAAEVYEQALNQHKSSFRRARKIAQERSNVKEEIWLKNASRISEGNNIFRGKCIKLAKILPKKALPACEEYLKTNADDPEVLEIVSRIKSKNEKLVLKSGVTGQKQPQPAATSTAGTAPDQGSKKTIIKTQIVKAPEPAKPVKKVAAQEVVDNSTAPEAPVDSVVIQDIRSQLQELYTLIEEKAKVEPVPKASANAIVEKGDRYAVVIGNANYDPRIGTLKNPANDASDIAVALRQLNFKVDLLIDSDLGEMERAIETLARKSKPEDTLLFYFAGHGVAIDGENYLIPAKTPFKDAIDVRYKALKLSYAMERMNRASIGSGVTLVMLDACRNNPFVAERGATRGGLATVSGPSGSLIAFATAPGMVAQDGDGRNGVYTKHLLKHIAKSGLKVEDMFKRVRVDVESATQGQQIPWENSSMRGDFYFNKS